ncbi:MAG: hypothetical protein AAF788_04665 [Pseudomonadota bacterium]
MVFVGLIVGLALLFIVVSTLRPAKSSPDTKSPLSFAPLSVPSDAAALLLARQAVLGQNLHDARERALPWFTQEFGLADDAAHQLWTDALEVARDKPHPEENLGKLIGPIKARCTLQEMKELGRMLTDIANLDDGAQAEQVRLADEVRRRLSLPRENDDASHNRTDA